MESSGCGPDGQASRIEKRPLKVEDLFRIQSIRNPVFSPDGRWLAYEVTRPVQDELIRRLTEFDQIHSDVWLAPHLRGRFA